MNILFVCTGNTCRSPMAEFLLKKYAEDNGLSDISVKSRGLCVPERVPMSLNSEKALEFFDIHPDGFLSEQLTKEELLWADKIYTMTKGHADAIKRSFPEFADKISSLGEKDIVDPFMQSEEVYIRTAEQIQKEIEGKFGGNIQSQSKPD